MAGAFAGLADRNRGGLCDGDANGVPVAAEGRSHRRCTIAELPCGGSHRQCTRAGGVGFAQGQRRFGRWRRSAVGACARAPGRMVVVRPGPGELAVRRPAGPTGKARIARRAPRAGWAPPIDSAETGIHEPAYTKSGTTAWWGRFRLRSVEGLPRKQHAHSGPRPRRTVRNIGARLERQSGSPRTRLATMLR